MFHSRKILASALAALVAAGTAGMAIAHDAQAAQPFACEIRAATSGGMIRLEGVVTAAQSLSGSYGFRVTGAGGGGNTRIQQGGGFSASAGQTVTLGTAMLGASQSYDASLTVDAGGMKLECADRV